MSSDDSIDVRLLRPEEAPCLVGLIRRCYGETYLDPSFYDVSAVTALLERGRLSSIGAFVGNELVGHMGITLRAHGGHTADAGMTLVDPSFRGRGIAKRVAMGLARQSIALGLVGVHDYPVTVHEATQRVEEESKDAERRGAVLAHVDLSLADPAAPVATAALCTLGFFFAGVLPEYRDGDVLRMQRLSKSISHDSGVLSEEGQSIEAFVVNDQRLAREVAQR